MAGSQSLHLYALRASARRTVVSAGRSRMSPNIRRIARRIVRENNPRFLTLGHGVLFSAVGFLRFTFTGDRRGGIRSCKGDP